MKKIISLIIALSLILSVLSVPVMAKDVKVRPYDNYYSTQNPPDFSWTYSKGATYSLKIATNKEMTENVIELTGLKKNLYNFPYTFEPGEYYWCYRINSNAYTEPTRFYIAENATEFTVPYDYSNIELNIPKEHPRILIGGKNKDILKTTSSTDYHYTYMKSEVDSGVRKGAPVLSGEIAADNLFSKYTEYPSLAARSALLWHTNGDEKYKNYAIDVLTALTEKNTDGTFKWAPENAIVKDSNGNFFDSSTDVQICLFAYYLGLSYDWMYNDMSEELRGDIRDLLEVFFKLLSEEWIIEGQYSANIYYSFLGAHNYRLNQIVPAALAVYNEVPKTSYANKIIDNHLPIMINITHPFSYQDGANAQGLFYGVGNELMAVSDMLADMGIIDLKEKQIYRNVSYRYPYMWTSELHEVFGDNYDSLPKDTYHYQVATQNIAATTKNPVMAKVVKWLFDESTTRTDYYYPSHIDTYVTNEKGADMEEKEPYMLPTSKYFKDVGWASLNSSLTGEDKITLRFKSSPYGSYNHSHPDQNSFTIDAFGEYMATDPDYYDAFHSTFDLGWNKKTYAHNAITYNDGQGQPYNDYRAQGDVTDFLYGEELDLVTGEAKDAYNVSSEVMNKVKRNIIYIKPDVFVIVDDLEAKNQDLNYEFWLNTRGTVKEYDGAAVTIEQGDVSMFSECVYPSVSLKLYENTFDGPDGTKITADAITTARERNKAKNNNDSRICYTTDAERAKQMITLLSFSKDGQNPVSYARRATNGYVRLIVTNTDTREKTTIYVNDGTNETVTASGISFTGDMAVVNDESVMLVNGTSLTYNNINYISSDNKISAVIKGNRLSISSINTDSNVKVYTKPVTAVHKTEDEREVKLTEGQDAYGIKYTTEGDFTTFKLYPGTYTLNLNDALHEGYTKITLESGSGGIISGTDRVMLGERAYFKLVPDAGYKPLKVLYNETELTVLPDGSFSTPDIEENAKVTATFIKEEEKEPSVTSFDTVFKSKNTSGGITFALFGSLDGMGGKPTEYGAIYSYENKDFTLEDVDGKTIRKLEAISSDSSSRYGIIITDKDISVATLAYARTYMTINNKTYYGQIKTLN